MKNYAYSKGWRKLTDDQKRVVMKGLMKIYNVKTIQSVYAYMRGDREPKASQSEATEKLFARFGITNIWGEKKKTITKL